MRNSKSEELIHPATSNGLAAEYTIEFGRAFSLHQFSTLWSQGQVRRRIRRRSLRKRLAIIPGIGERYCGLEASCHTDSQSSADARRACVAVLHDGCSYEYGALARRMHIRSQRPERGLRVMPYSRRGTCQHQLECFEFPGRASH